MPHRPRWSLPPRPLPPYPLLPGTLGGEAALAELWARASLGGAGAAAPGLLAASAAFQSL
ncbi:hypothetical protein [Deinococcus sp.]|uniref:hypothetical protein n=1 Tax=Deinococcus sp. TaxID=47478 RepID=UPI0025CD06D3|nr:hypothetical protein [Deinococcus sp.]